MYASIPRPVKAAIAMFAAALLMAACAGRHPQEAESSRSETLSIAALVESACRAAARSGQRARHCPRYLEMLTADGRITVGLGIGTPDLGRLRLPEDPASWQSTRSCKLFGRDVIIDSRLILTNKDFRAALGECEVLFVASHSRFGAGPVFMHDGKANPFRMQTTPGYEITMPDSEVAGYRGRVLRTFHNTIKNKGYTVFAPDGRDLESSTPLHACQLLVMATCSSQKHFLDDIRTFRRGYPTTAIFVARPSLMDIDMRVFRRMLYEMLRGSSAQEIVRGLNDEYRAVAWSEMKRGRPPWKIVDGLFTLGIDTVAQ